MHPTKEFLPRTYGISWDAERFSLLFRIEKRMIPGLKKFLQADSPIMEAVIKECGGTVPNFQLFGEPGGTIGFDHTFVYEREDEYELVYRFTPNPFVYQSTDVCPDCRGTKVSEFGNGDCRECRKTGYEHRHTHSNQFICGMLTYYLLSWFLAGQLLHENYEKLQPTDRRQIISIEISYTSGMHNCSISGWASDEVFKWIEQAKYEEGKEIANIMFTLENHLWLYSDKNNMSFRFIPGENNAFWLQVPGSAATLGSENILNLYRIGRMLCPHNIDHRVNQFYLIAGMAMLSDKVEAWLKEK